MTDSISTAVGVPARAARALQTAGAAADSSGISAGRNTEAAAQAPVKSAGTAEINYFPPEQSDGFQSKSAADPNYFPPKTTSSTKSEQTETANVQFSRDSDTGESLIQFVDADGHVVEQIPPKQLLETITELCKTAGILVNKSV